jgi:cysteine desulfurase
VYLDHAATTPLRPEALEAMLPHLRDHWGNPSGSHTLARQARRALDDARELVADSLGCRPGEVVFTGGGTEADNQAVAGVLDAHGDGVAVCSAIEHHAVLHAVTHAGGTVVGVDARGVIDLDALEAALADATDTGRTVRVVSVMLANNEVGTVQPLDAVAAVVAEHAPHAVVHTDAVHAAPWLDLAVAAAPAALVALSAHKFGGPKGVGVLVVRAGTRIAPLLHGGGQEHDRRSGTHNVAGIVGLAEALRATVAERSATVARVAALRDRLVGGLVAAVAGVRETVPAPCKTAGNAHVLIDGIENEALLFLLDRAGICASGGSACASGAMEPSHVLAAMGVERTAAFGAVRFTLGTTTTDADVDAALAVVPGAVAQLRRGAP